MGLFWTLVVGFLLGTYVYADTTLPKITPPDPGMGQQAPARYLASYIGLPPVVAILSTPLQVLANKSVPVVYHFSEKDQMLPIGLANIYVRGNIWRGPLQLTFMENRYEAQASGWFWLKFVKNKWIHLGECGQDAPIGAQIKFAGTIEWSPEWRLKVVVQPGPLITEACQVTGADVNITSGIRKIGNKFLTEQATGLESLLASKVDLRPKVMEIWQVLQAPIQLSDKRWLLLNAIEVKAAPIVLSQTEIRSGVSLSVRPVFVTGPPPVTQTTDLPPLKSGPVLDQFKVLDDIRISFTRAAELLRKELNIPTTLSIAGNALTMSDLSIYGTDEKVVLAVVLDQPNHRVFFEAAPVSRDQTLHITEFDYTFETRRILEQAAYWMLHDSLRSTFEKAMDSILSREVRHKLDKLRLTLNKEMNRQLGHDTTLQTDHISVTPDASVGPWMTSQELVLPIVIEGNARINIRRQIHSDDLVYLQTRLGFYLNSYASTGAVQAINAYNSDPASSDELFKIRRLAGLGMISSGDRVLLITRLGYFLNSHASTGPVSAIRNPSYDPQVSDEIFIIEKHSGSPGDPIYSGDKIYLKTRRNHFFNSIASAGPIQAIPTRGEDPSSSDEIFSIVKGP